MSKETDTMTKEEFADGLLCMNTRNQTCSQKAQALYERYRATKNGSDLSDLLTYVSAACEKVISDQLWAADRFSREDVLDIQQDATLHLLLHFQNEQPEDYCNYVLTYCKRAYKNKTTDFLRRFSSFQGARNTLPLEKQNEDGEVYEIYGEDSLEQERWRRERQLRCQAAIQLQIEYCRLMMDYRREPQKALALCYGRVLYQLEYFEKNYSLSDFLTEPAVAHARMGQRNLEALALDSETSLSRLLETPLRWSPAYRENLQQKSPYRDQAFWKDLVYVKEFTTVQTSHWVDSIGASVCNKLRKSLEHNAQWHIWRKQFTEPLAKLLNDEEVER